MFCCAYIRNVLSFPYRITLHIGVIDMPVMMRQMLPFSELKCEYTQITGREQTFWCFRHKEYLLTCDWCSHTFHSKRPQRKYCCAAHKQKMWRFNQRMAETRDNLPF